MQTPLCAGRQDPAALVGTRPKPEPPLEQKHWLRDQLLTTYERDLGAAQFTESRHLISPI
jgi:hypothetical protein